MVDLVTVYSYQLWLVVSLIIDFSAAVMVKMQLFLSPNVCEFPGEELMH